jgi:Kef-type K+ transport system membrane component KefB
MKKVLIYSLLLIVGLIGSQLLPAALGGAFHSAELAIKLATMFCLSFIMIHVGYEFELDKANPRKYAWDYLVAATAAAFPWVFCALYFVFVLAPPELWSSGQLWRESLLESRFASPTSAGVLFSMLAAAGLAATWVFQKARVLAIFDDLDTVLFMIPLQMLMVGMRWQLGASVLVMFVMMWLAWRYLHEWRIPISWPWVMGYAAAIALVCEGAFLLSARINKEVPIHMEVLLPAFALGCMLARPRGADPHRDDALEGHEEGPESPREQRVSTVVSAWFMLLVGLSMPAVFGGAAHGDGPRPDWGVIALHVLAVTAISNLGKMFPALCYRKEATLRERLALSVAMFPRGEVGAGVLVISIGYGIGGVALTVAMLSLALNLVCTGLFILIVRGLIADVPARAISKNPGLGTPGTTQDPA